MKKKLLNISGKIDPFTLEVLTLVAEAANSLNIDFFVIGASARDIIMKLIYGIANYRKTNDIDFSVRVLNWVDYNKLKVKLLQNGFSTSKIIHKISYKSIQGIDIIPFGKISIDSKSIVWPDQQKKEMSVLGFEECFADSVSIIININPQIIIKVASARGLAIMKLISWKDGFPSRTRDANDILFIIKNYLTAGNEKRLFDENNDLIDDDFDFVLTGATLLGRDISNLANQTTLSFLKDLLDNEIKFGVDSKLIMDMNNAEILLDIDKYDSNKKHLLKLIKNLRIGMN